MNKTIHKIKLKTLSPLHIGSDDTLTSVGEYVILDGKVKIINQDNLYQILQKEELFEDYIDYIAREHKEANVWEGFLQEKDISDKVTFHKEIEVNLPVEFNTTGNNLLELAIETAGKKYVPGSTLKGAIRSILFAKYILENNYIADKIEKIIKEECNKKSDNNNPIRNRTKLNKIRKRVKKVEASESINHFYNKLRLTDSETFEDTGIQIEQTRRVNFFKQATGEVDLLRETVKSDATTQFEIHLDNNIKNIKIEPFKKEPFKDFTIDKLFQIINEIQTKLIDFEIELLNKSTLSETIEVKNRLIKTLENYKKEISSYNNKTALLRLGKGKTLFFQTVLSVLSKEARKQVIELMIKEEQDSSEFPHTRVLTGYNEMFGWVKLSLSESDTVKSQDIEKEIVKASKPVLKMKDNIVTIQQGQKITAYNIDDKTARFLINGEEHIAQLIRPHKKIYYEEGQELNVQIHQIKKATNTIIQIKVI